MYIPEKMKLNKFQHVNLPTPRDMFKRYGLLMTPANMYGGEENLIQPELTKVEQIYAGETMIKKKQMKLDKE